jgi:DNA-binding NarL/FixJ family response regulator
MPSIRVSIVDPLQLPREGLRLLLAGAAYDVIGATPSLAAALADIKGGARPDLLVVVLRDSGDSFESATLQRIRAITPECKIVLIASDIAPELPARANDWGANALLRSDMSGDVLTRSLRLVMHGQAIFPVSSSTQSSASDDSLGGAVDAAAARMIAQLSDNEARILNQLVVGHSNKAIARELGVPEVVVKTQMKALLRKLNVHSRTQAAIWALDNGFSERRGPIRSRC